MEKQHNQYDHLFTNVIPLSMEGIQIFGSNDQYFKPQDYPAITKVENDIWDKLFGNIEPLINQYVSAEYLCGMNQLPIPQDKFPDFNSISPLLEKETKWELIPVAGFLDEKLFFDLNAKRQFPVTDIIRKSPRFDEKYLDQNIKNEDGYTPEPDIFHDIQGHVPFLMDEAYANFMHEVGILGDKILRDERQLGHELVSHNLKRLQNFAWWTYEFGVMKNNGQTDSLRRTINDIEYEIYGAGIISSYDETLNVVKCAKKESSHSKFLPYDIEEIVMTCFDYSSIQNRYYVIDSMDDLYDSFKRNADLFWYEG